MRPSAIAVTLGMLAVCGGLAYLHANREQTATGPAGLNKLTHATATTHSSAPVAASPISAAASANPQAHTPHPSESTSTEVLVTPEAIAQRIRDTESADARTRATAIAALANGPKAQVLPALEHVLDSGERDIDRQIALQSMYSLALRDGDPNGQVRDAMRHAIYHGDDDGVTQTAQSLLDDIEAEFTLREQNQPHR